MPRAGSLVEAAPVADHLLEERAGPVSLVAGLLTQLPDGAEHAVEPDFVAPGEETLRIIHAFGHREVHVGRGADAEMHRVGGFVYQHRENAVDDAPPQGFLLRRLRLGRALAVLVKAAP